MKFIEPSVEILSDTNPEYITEQLKVVEKAGRVCYKSEDKTTEESHNKMISMLLNKKHESVMEHANVTVRLTGSRGFSHQLIRHRIAAYSQESQRYVNYSKNKYDNSITFIKPVGYEDWNDDNKESFVTGLLDAESCYMELIKGGMKAEDARGVLPNQTKTEVVVTMNLRSWRHFFSMRCDKHAQSEIRHIAKLLLKEMSDMMPIIFRDLKEEYLDAK